LINQISIVIPALNEEESIPSLVDELNAELESANLEFEIIIVDDGSTMSLKKIISNPRVQVLENSFNRGQSFSILKGIEHSSYEYIVTLDGDGQNPPSEIIKLVDEFNKDFENVDVVCGYRKNRRDKFVRSLYSKVANFLIRLVTKSKCKDLGCSLKIFKKEMVEDIKYNGDIHRILIPLFEFRNYRLKQIEVEHFERKSGETKYGFERVTAVIVDSILLYLTDGFVNTARYSLSKLSFIFGAISTLLFAISYYQKIINLVFVHRNPLFIIGIVFFIIFLQLFTFSLISFFLENKKNN
jgi:glycosyltransferase involved in cell wall biosynthesis